MTIDQSWAAVRDALEFATSRIDGDEDPLNDRERADGHAYVARVLNAVTDSVLMGVDPGRATFLPMLESVRYLGAAGPDIDYDVAILVPGRGYRVTGRRGGASYVGIAVYSNSGAAGASAIVASIDVDQLADADGSFVYEFSHPDAARLIVRQYFHDRVTQERGSWEIEQIEQIEQIVTSTPAATAAVLPSVPVMTAKLANAAHTIRWNAQLNQLWTPELRATPNRFVRQTADDIVAAIPNPDVMYAFTWWRIPEGQALVVEFTPPETRYWALQLCDRWFQCFPDRRSNLNDGQVELSDGGVCRIVVSDGDPGHPNWLDTSGHRTGILFFRWLHADPSELPTCRVVPLGEVPTI